MWVVSMWVVLVRAVVVVSADAGLVSFGAQWRDFVIASQNDVGRRDTAGHCCVTVFGDAGLGDHMLQ